MIIRFKDHKIRNIEKMQTINNGDRNLSESILAQEVILALNDWINNNVKNCVLIGGIALSYYVKPRYTEDVDILFLTSDDIPENVYLFKKHINGAFQHNKTHVEVETVTPQSINTSFYLVQKVFETSIFKNGIRVASPEGLISLKMGRFSRRDQADIEDLVNYLKSINKKIDLSDFNLTSDLLEKFEKEFL